MNCYRNVVCGTLAEHVPEPEIRTRLRELYRPLDIRDQILINGTNHSGLGCALYVFSGTMLQLSSCERAWFTRLATHLSTAYRLQRRLEQGSLASTDSVVAAVLNPQGRIEHAAGTASSRQSRRALGEAVKSREWARSRKLRTDLRRATDAWKPELLFDPC